MRFGDWKAIWGRIGPRGTTDWIPDISYNQSCEKLLPPNHTFGLSASFVEEHFYFDDQLCAEDSPCLFNIKDDPEERTDLSTKHPDIVADIQNRLKEYVENKYTGGLDKAKTSQNDYCEFIKEKRWVQPYE